MSNSSRRVAISQQSRTCDWNSDMCGIVQTSFSFRWLFVCALLRVSVSVMYQICGWFKCKSQIFPPLNPVTADKLSQQTNAKPLLMCLLLSAMDVSLRSVTVCFVSHSLIVVRRYPVFLGRPHRSWLRQEPLHIQRILQVNRTLYIGARYNTCAPNILTKHIHHDHMLVWALRNLAFWDVSSIACNTKWCTFKYSSVRPLFSFWICWIVRYHQICYHAILATFIGHYFRSQLQCLSRDLHLLIKHTLGKVTTESWVLPMKCINWVRTE